MKVSELTADEQSAGSDEQRQLFLTNIEYEEHDGAPITHLWGRDADGELHHDRIYGHSPNFHLPSDVDPDSVRDHYAVTDVSEGRQSLDGDTLWRVETNLPKQVPDVREVFGSGYEADVFYTTRFLIDTGIWTGYSLPNDEADEYHVGELEPCDSPDVDPTVVTVDIEVASEDGFPDTDDADWPVSTIVGHNSRTDEYVGWLLSHQSHGSEILSNGVVSEESELDDYRVFDSEDSLLNDFNDWVSAQRPDILTGWFSNDFDYPYLINRCREVGVWSYRDWSPLGDVWVTNNRGEPRVKGVTMLDMLDAYQKTQIHELDSKALGDVAAVEVGADKLDVDESHTTMWKNDPVQFLAYNKRDVELVVRIEQSGDIIDTFNHLRDVTGAQYSSCLANIDMLDTLFLREAKQRGYALPTATKPDRDWYYGADVIEPTAGIHEHGLYPDYASLYPNGMYQCNISPETLVGTEEDLRESEYTEDDCVWAYVDTRPDNIKQDSDPQFEKCYYLSPDVKEGFVRKVIDKLMGLTEGVDDPVRYEAMKRPRNSCFTPDTEVLTPDGVVNITELDVGDEVYSFDEETDSVVVKPVTETHQYPERREELTTIETSRIDLSVTRDHEMIVKRSRHSDEWERVEAGELHDWTNYQLPNGWSERGGEHRETFDITEWVDEYLVVVDNDVHGHAFRSETGTTGTRRTRDSSDTGAMYVFDSDAYEEHRSAICEYGTIRGVQYESGHGIVPKTYDWNDVIELVGWVVSEGSFYDGTSKTITISQNETNDGHRGAIRDCLERMGLSYTEQPEQFSIHNTLWYDVLVEWVGDYSYNKHLPSWAFDCSVEQKQLLLDTMMAGDGDTSNGNRYTTASQELRDDVLQLCTHLGYNCRYRWDGVEHRPCDGVWRVRFDNGRQTFRMHRSGGTDYSDGGVYCVTVEDTHSLLAGRNGNFTFVGNCYGVLGDSNSYGKGFRLYDWRMAESTTLQGRKILRDGADEYVEYITNEYDVDAYIFGGDTDSFMTSISGAESRDEAIAIGEDAVTHVNEWLDGYCYQQFGVTDHAMELELESYSTKCFFPARNPKSAPNGEGVKKRYATLITWDEGDDVDELNIKGFEAVRSDVAIVTTEMQERLLELILRQPVGEAIDVFSEELSEVVNAIEDGEYPLSKLGRPFGIGQAVSKYGSPDRRPQPSYRGAKYANRVIYETDAIGEGDKPLLFYIDRVGGDWRKTYTAETAEDGDYVDAVSVLDADDLPVDFHVDAEKMIDKTLRDPLNPILQTLGYDFDDVIADSEQMSLSDCW